jgi:hypothetical protein
VRREGNYGTVKLVEIIFSVAAEARLDTLTKIYWLMMFMETIRLLFLETKETPINCEQNYIS